MDRERAEEFHEFASSRYSALMRRAYLLTGSQHDAEDLVQTTLAKAFRSWQRIREREAADAYVRRIMVNTHTSRLRRPFRETPAERIPEQARSDEQAQVALRDEMRRVLMRLPRRQRAAVVLRYYEDLSEQETAELLGVTVGTVKASVSRAMSALRKDVEIQAAANPPGGRTRSGEARA